MKHFLAACLLFQPSEIISLLKKFFLHAEIAATQTGGTVDEQAVYKNLVAEIESWYNELGDRVTAWYKAKTKLRIFWLGVVLALVLNVDSVELFKDLNSNPSAQKILLDAYVQNGAQWSKLASAIDTENKQQQTNTKKVPVPADSSKEVLVDSAKKGPVTDSLKSLSDSLLHFTKSMDTMLHKAGLPIGWTQNIFNPPKPNPDGIWWFLLKLIGIGLSGIAASFGAPFWFDLLKKAYSLKSK